MSGSSMPGGRDGGSPVGPNAPGGNPAGVRGGVGPRPRACEFLPFLALREFLDDFVELRRRMPGIMLLIWPIILRASKNRSTS